MRRCPHCRVPLPAGDHPPRRCPRCGGPLPRVAGDREGSAGGGPPGPAAGPAAVPQPEPTPGGEWAQRVLVVLLDDVALCRPELRPPPPGAFPAGELAVELARAWRWWREGAGSALADPAATFRREASRRLGVTWPR